MIIKQDIDDLKEVKKNIQGVFKHSEEILERIIKKLEKQLEIKKLKSEWLLNYGNF